MKRIFILTSIFILLSGYQLFCQVKNQFSVQYDISFGAGDLGDFITKPSFRGASVQYRYAVKNNILLGGDLAWNVFYEKNDYATYTEGTQSLSGIQYRYQNGIPILFQTDYLFNPDKKFAPFVGIGIGTLYTERKVNMNIYIFEINTWQFLVKPEAGFLYNISEKTSLKLGAKYYYGFKSSELESQSYITVSVGFAFHF